MSSLSYVRFGGCKAQEESSRFISHYTCALEPTDCRYDDIFVTPDTLTVFDHYSCDSVYGVRIGRCQDSNKCTKVATGCNDPNSFSSEMIRDQRCSVLEDERYGTLTYFTSCHSMDTDKNSNKVCVLSANECQTTNNYRVAQFHDSFCDCSNTLTGACFLNQEGTSANDKYYCAVSEEACNGSSMSFRTALELKASGMYDCRLCDDSAPLIQQQQNQNSSSTTTERMLQIVTGVLIVTLLMGVGVLCCLLRRRNRRNQSNRTSSSKMIVEGEIQDTNDHDHNETAIEEESAVETIEDPPLTKAEEQGEFT